METKYKIGDIVYLITDLDQAQRMVTGIILRPNTVLYMLSLGSSETNHYEVEISCDKNWSK